ncbi:MAG: HypC/HybG/HupF family hydrogenase formation chaperone [bacterium]
MCLAIPVLVTEVKGNTAIVDIGGVSREMNAVLIPDIGVGDYVLMHAGFGIEILDPHEAQKTLELIREISG